MRIVIALCERLLHKQGGPAGPTQESPIRQAAAQLALLADGNELVVVQPGSNRITTQAPHSHNGSNGYNGNNGSNGNPRHTLNGDAFADEADVSLAYRLELELRNLLPSDRPCATLLSTVEVDSRDPAFAHPDKPVGAVLLGERALAAARAKHWCIARDRIGYRRVVPNPRALRLLQAEPLHRLVEQGTVVVCAIGGMPVAADGGGLHGVEALIDCYSGAVLVAEAIEADVFVIATEMAGVFLDWGTANSKLLRHGHPSALREFASTLGSMEPTLQAASDFAERTGRRAAIGALNDVARLVDGSAGTTISCERADPRRFEGGAVAC